MTSKFPVSCLLFWAAISSTTPALTSDQLPRMIPPPGSFFSIHQDRISSGTLSVQDSQPLPFRQETSLEFSVTVLEGATEGETLLRCLYDRVRLTLFIRDSSSTVLLEPDRVVLDGTPVYDSLANPDLPESVLSHLLNEAITVVLDRQGQVTHILGNSENRTRFAFLDLVAPLLESIDSLPPHPPELGETWTRRSPRPVLSHSLEVPATATYRFVQAVTDTVGSLWIWDGTASAGLPREQTVSNRLGSIAPLNLRSDLLGPDLYAAPPEILIATLECSSQGRLSFRPAWGFPVSWERVSKIHFETLSPNVDSTHRLKRNLELDIASSTQVQKHDFPELDKGTVRIWLGQ